MEKLETCTSSPIYAGTSAIWDIVENDELFNPIKSIYGGFTSGKFMLFDTHEDWHDGCFPRVSDWTRLCNRIDKYGESEYLTWISSKKNKLVADTCYCKIVRESKWESQATLYFEKPIKVIFGEVNGEPIVKEVNKIKGEFHIDWLWRLSGRQDKIANGIEVYFDCQEFELV